MTKLTTQQTWRVALVVNGVDCGVWDTRTGGDQSSDANPYFPGAMAPQKALPPGPPTVADVTLTRVYDGDRDDALVPVLLAANVSGETATCKQRALDGTKTAYGRSYIWTGTLSGVSVPEVDSKSKDPATITVKITPDGPLVTS